MIRPLIAFAVAAGVLITTFGWSILHISSWADDHYDWDDNEDEL